MEPWEEGQCGGRAGALQLRVGWGRVGAACVRGWGARVCACVCVCVSVKGRAAGQGMWDYVIEGGLLWLHVGVGACSHPGLIISSGKTGGGHLIS